MSELNTALDPILKGIERTQSQQQKIMLDYEEAQKAFKNWQTEKDERDAKNQKALDELIIRSKDIHIDQAKQTFAGQLKLALAENYEAIKTVRKGHGHGFQMKVPATMTEATHLTGGAVRSYLDPAMLPGSAGINFRDICQIIQTATGWITLPRETPGDPAGSISKTPEGTAKPLIDYKFNMVDYKAEYIAGYARISKQMLQDLPFLQSWLPRMLLRDFIKAENAQFYADLAAVATGSGTTAATVYAEKLIDWLANLGSAGFVPSNMIGTYAEWATLLKTTSGAGGQYGLPGATIIDPSGTVRVAGVPFNPASWIASGKTIVGDFSLAAIGVADNLKVEMFEQDQDNVIKNLVTVRVEAREVLVIEQPGAFIHV